MPRSSPAVTRALHERRYPSSRNNSSLIASTSHTRSRRRPGPIVQRPLRTGQAVIEIDPILVLCLNQIDLPIPSPALDLFFSAQGRFPVWFSNHTKRDGSYDFVGSSQ